MSDRFRISRLLAPQLVDWQEQVSDEQYHR